METGPAGTLITWTRVLLWSLHHLTCPQHSLTAHLVRHSCFFVNYGSFEVVIFVSFHLLISAALKLLLGYQHSQQLLVWGLFLLLITASP